MRSDRGTKCVGTLNIIGINVEDDTVKEYTYETRMALHGHLTPYGRV